MVFYACGCIVNVHLRRSQYARRLLLFGWSADGPWDSKRRVGVVRLLMRPVVQNTGLRIVGGAQRDVPTRCMRPALAQRIGRGTAANDLHELVQDHEFKAQFYAIDGCFEDSLDVEEVCEFCCEQCCIQEDDEHIDPDEVFENLVCLLLLEQFARTQYFTGFVEVKAGDDDLLAGEACHLYLFVDVIDVEPSVGVREGVSLNRLVSFGSVIYGQNRYCSPLG